MIAQLEGSDGCNGACGPLSGCVDSVLVFFGVGFAAFEDGEGAGGAGVAASSSVSFEAGGTAG